MKVVVHNAEVAFRAQQLVTPLQISSGTITSVTEASAAVTVECDGRTAIGLGTVYLSNIWAWPYASISQQTQIDSLQKLCRTIAAKLPALTEEAVEHPLEIGFRLHDFAMQAPLPADPPALARAMCLSPFDAALHDGVGIALERSAFDLFREPAPVPSADKFFDGGACRAIGRLIRPPIYSIPAWYIVSKDDALDGVVASAIRDNGYFCLKLKLTGRDNSFDVARTVDVYRTARAVCDRAPRLSIDTNEANPSAESVLDYLVRLEQADPDAYRSLEYLEQPTNRDIRRHPFDWREVARRKPVMLDEGLTDLDVLEEAQWQGYSGLALKTCKGQSMLLAAAAWALDHQMSITLQDLTNPGIALIHGALVGSRLPTINGAELNSPQFTPAANAEFLPRLHELFEPRRGVHRLPNTEIFGLGSHL